MAPHRDQPGNNVALLIIDIVNCFDFEGGEKVRQQASAAAPAIRALRDQADACHVPTIYANDNFGEWHSERTRLVDRANGWLAQSGLAPRADDYFIIKPQFSAFYATNLAVLLPKLGVRRLVLTGIATDICILFTAADAHMRDYRLWVPENAVAAQERGKSSAALAILRERLDAEIAPTTQLSLTEWIAKNGARNAAP
jgi:nicotinamidase-related amidase